MYFKRFLALVTTSLLALTLFAGLGMPTATANEKAGTSKSTKTVKSGKCAPTAAVGHAPTDIEIPERVMTTRQASRTIKQIVLETNCGEIVIRPLYQARLALTAVNALVRSGYYDKSLCHRLTTEGIFVLQCGDPTATGQGFPNFTFNQLENVPEDEADNYPSATVAMANSFDRITGQYIMGSQFFIVYEDTYLPPNYTIFGRVIKGLDIVKMIAKTGTRNGSGDGAPKQVIAIERALIR